MKLKRKDCLICDRVTNKYLNICDSCYSILVPKKEGIVKNFKFVDRAYACFYYNPLFRDILRRYKFGNQRYLYRLFSEILLEKIMDLKLYEEIDLIIPVPLHRDTLIKRGFNQVDLLAEEIGKILKVEVLTRTLVKNKFTEEQVKLNLEERKVNLKDAFDIKNPEKIKGKRILLIDDIITTGSTLEECSKVLKEFGSGKIIGLSIGTTS